jgi:iron complex outermembrane receptor protein
MGRMATTSAGLLAAMALAPTWARAETDAGKAAGPLPTTSISEVIVTAQKRREKLQDLPIAVSAYTTGLRELRGVDTVQDIA